MGTENRELFGIKLAMMLEMAKTAEAIEEGRAISGELKSQINSSAMNDMNDLSLKVNQMILSLVNDGIAQQEDMLSKTARMVGETSQASAVYSWIARA